LPPPISIHRPPPRPKQTFKTSRRPSLPVTIGCYSKPWKPENLGRRQLRSAAAYVKIHGVILKHGVYVRSGCCSWAASVGETHQRKLPLLKDVGNSCPTRCSCYGASGRFWPRRRKS
jgi:hypothetical protein